MVSVVEEKIEYQNFIHKIISSWSAYANEIDENDINKPIISPTQFYRKNDK